MLREKDEEIVKGQRTVGLVRDSQDIVECRRLKLGCRTLFGR
jgi:hypothetical protein